MKTYDIYILKRLNYFGRKKQIQMKDNEGFIPSET